MRSVFRSTLIIAIMGTASGVHALESGDWDALEDTAQNSLEYAATDESVPWVNPDSGTEGMFTPVATHEGPEGQVCREYAVDAIIDGREEVVYGTACRLPDGSWVEANAEYPESDPPEPAAERETGDPGRRVDTGRDGQGMSLGGGVQIAQRHAGLGTDRSGVGIDVDGLHLPERDHQATVAHGVSGDVVAGPEDGEPDAMLSSELHRVAHVPFDPAVHDQTGPTVDHGVPEGSGVVILRRFRRE